MSEENRLVFLKGKNVVLRPVLKSDIPNLMRWVNDPDVRIFLKSFLPKNEADEIAWIDKLSKEKSTEVVLVIETADGRAIGTMGIHRINWLDRTATTGTLIGEKEYQGKGLGSEAKLLLLDYAFNTLNLRKICSGAYAFNERSIRYSLRCGYKEEGRLREHVFRDGKYHNKVLLAIFKEDFEPIWKKYKESV